MKPILTMIFQYFITGLSKRSCGDVIFKDPIFSGNEVFWAATWCWSRWTQGKIQNQNCFQLLQNHSEKKDNTKIYFLLWKCLV